MANNNQRDDPSAVLAQVQAIEQALHAQTAQRMSIQSQLHEMENATSELSKSQESYRIIGNVMVKADTAVFKKELEERVESLRQRVATFERSEERLRAELKKAQESVLRG